MQELDVFGNPTGTTYPGEEGCPQDMICLTEEGFNQLLAESDMVYNTESHTVEPMGDAEAVLDFTTQLLFLDFWTIAYLAIPLTIFAVYGLSIYAGFKWIQKKLS